MRKFVVVLLGIVGTFIFWGCNNVDKVLEEAYQELQIPGDLTAVKSDLELVTQIGEVEVVWESKNEGVILPDGKVTQRDGERHVILIATLKYKNKTKVKIFEVTVLAKNTTPPTKTLEQIKLDYEQWLTEYFDFEYVTRNIELPNHHPQYQDDIYWTSSDPTVIDVDGTVNRQDTNRQVTLIVHVRVAEGDFTLEFVVTVLAKTVTPQPPTQTLEEFKADYLQWLRPLFDFEFIIDDINLPLSHPYYEDKIVWTSSDPNVISTTGKVTRSDVDQEVTLTANIKVSEFEFILEFKITVLNVFFGQGTETIHQIRNKPLGSNVETIGVVTEVSSDAIYIQDKTGAIHVYVRSESDYLDTIEEGNLVKVKGKLANFRTLLQITNPTIEVLKDSVKLPDIIEITSFSKEVLALVESMKVSFDKAKIVTLPTLKANSDNEIEISLGGTVLKIFIKKHIDASVIEQLNQKLSYFQVGDEISVRGVMVGIFDGKYQFILTEADNILDKNISLEEKHIAVKKQIAYILNRNNQEVKRRIEFITSSIFNSKITYEFSHPQILSVGVFNPQEENITVTIKVTIWIDGVAFTEEPITVTVVSKLDTGDELSEYYQEAEGKTGEALKSALRMIISRNYKSIGYSSTSYIIEKSDLHPEKEGVLLLIYNRETAKAEWDNAESWNKEHVWPKSRLGNASKSDIHNLRASDPDVNSSRGNDPFADGSGSYGRVSGGWYPGDDDKGDVARIVLYMHVRWGISINKGTVGDLNMFIRWHYEDQVDEFEIHRNEVIFQEQRNRNPFIDYPDFVEMIWGVQSYSLGLEYNIVNNDIIVSVSPSKVLFEIVKTKPVGFDMLEYTPVYALINRRELM